MPGLFIFPIDNDNKRSYHSCCVMRLNLWSVIMNSQLVVPQQKIKMIKLLKFGSRMVEVEVTPDTWQPGDENKVVPLFQSNSDRSGWGSVPDAWFAEDHRKHYEAEMRAELLAEWAAQWGI
jgi:hypothetical protein